PDRRCVSAQSFTEPKVYQPDKELEVDIGSSANLHCCFYNHKSSLMNLFVQPNGKKPWIIVKFHKNNGESFYNGFQKTRFQIKRSSDCFSLTILNIIQSDEAVYYCALTSPNIVFG
ncbi:hypothetical protein HF521_018180, partial [Silurus meridionalis]